jgi:hypothetical protein
MINLTLSFRRKFSVKCLTGQELVCVRYEFRICSGAQFMQVHALPLSLDRYAKWTEAVEEPIHAIGQGQNETQQRGYANQLSQPLAGRPSGWRESAPG